MLQGLDVVYDLIQHYRHTHGLQAMKKFRDWLINLDTYQGFVKNIYFTL